MTRARADLQEALDLLHALTVSESPSDDDGALAACAEVLARTARDVVGLEATPLHPRAGGPPALRLESGGAGAREDGRGERVLLLGHLDTVWPLGTLDRRPFDCTDGVVTGPGVFDMKAGLVQALLAMRDLGCREDGGPPVTLLVTFDEEIGSPAGRALVESEAARAQAVLVLEPAGPGGATKQARKGWGRYDAVVTGRAAHVGLDPEAGRNALVELAHFVTEVHDLDGARSDLRVIPTTARVGVSANTIPELASLTIDVRGARADDLAWAEEQLRGVAARAGRSCRVEIDGGVNRPPMESVTGAALVPRVERAARAAGVDVPPPVAVGGVSDGNFTAALGIPTLDGLGAVGGGAHAEHEWVDAGTMPQRAALLGALVHDLTEDPLGA